MLVAATVGGVTLGVPGRAVAATDLERMDDLIASMTLRENAGQKTFVSDTLRPFHPPNSQMGIQDEAELAAEVRRGRVGSLFNGYGKAGARRGQDIAVEQGRLRIPLLFAGDVIHGLKTIFPAPLGEASSLIWNWQRDRRVRALRRHGRRASSELCADGLSSAQRECLGLAEPAGSGAQSGSCDGIGKAPRVSRLVASPIKRHEPV